MSQGGDIANAMQTAAVEEMEEEEEIDEDGEGEEMEEEEEEEEEEEMDEEEEDVDNNAMHYQTAWHSLGVENGDDVGDDDGDWEDIDEDDDQEEEGIIINTDDSDVRPGVSLSVSIPIVD